MENASKFLYMAAGILISLMVLMLMVFLFIRGSYLTAEYDIKISDEEKAHKLLNKLVVNGINIDKFEIKKPTLNDIFIEKVGEC